MPGGFLLLGRSADIHWDRFTAIGLAATVDVSAATYPPYNSRVVRPSTRRSIFLIGAVAVGSFAVWRAGPTNQLRYEHQLALPPLPSTIRPSMLLTPILALGRAPLVDYLWLRATKLKEEGHFFDAYQLSEMICELQPKFAPVWAFQAGTWPTTFP